MPKGVPKASKPRLDPLLAALIDKLPPSDFEWTVAAREAWLTMMRTAFEVVYGPSGADAAVHRTKKMPNDLVPGAGPATGAMVSPAAAGMQPRQCRYHIDPDGDAKRDDTWIDASDIPPGTVVLDYRPQPVDPEIDLIMWRTTGSKPQPLPAGVVIRPAAEAYTGKPYNGGVTS